MLLCYRMIIQLLRLQHSSACCATFAREIQCHVGDVNVSAVPSVSTVSPRKYCAVALDSKTCINTTLDFSDVTATAEMALRNQGGVAAALVVPMRSPSEHRAVGL